MVLKSKRISSHQNVDPAKGFPTVGWVWVFFLHAGAGAGVDASAGAGAGWGGLNIF